MRVRRIVRIRKRIEYRKWDNQTERKMTLEVMGIYHCEDKSKKKPTVEEEEKFLSKSNSKLTTI